MLPPRSIIVFAVPLLLLSHAGLGQVQSPSPEANAADPALALPGLAQSPELAEKPAPRIETPTGVPSAARAILPETAQMFPPVIHLADAQRLALINNPSLRAAEQRVQQARARVRQATSAYFPQLAGTFNAARTSLPENVVQEAREAAFAAPFLPLQAQFQQTMSGPAPMPEPRALARQALQAGVAGAAARSAVPDTIHNYEMSVTATWLLFDGLGRWFTRSAARHGFLQTEASFRESQRLLLNAVARAFYNVQLQRENIRIAEADMAYNERLLVDAQARRRVGTGSLSDVLNFEIRVRAAEAMVLRARNSYTVALVGLAALMGLPDAGIPAGVEIAEMTAPEPQELDDPPPLELLLAAAEQLRPDLQAGRYAVRGARDITAINRAQYWPTAALFASQDAQRTDNARFETDDFASTVGVAVSYDLFTGFRRRAQVAEARAVEAETQRLLQNAEITAYSEVRQALDDVLTGIQELTLERLNMENVERNRELVEREYDVGQASLVRLNEAQRDLLQAQGRLALARVSLRQAWFALATATGESLLPYLNADEAHLSHLIDNLPQMRSSH